MEATYCIGSDMDVCRMFDQYLYKRSENLDVSLSVSGHLHNGYTTLNEQTFHTPSFGDEDFDIPPINPHHGGGQQNMGYHPTQVSMPLGHSMGEHPHTAYHQPLYLSQHEHLNMNINGYGGGGGGGGGGQTQQSQQGGQSNGYRLPPSSLQQLQHYSMGPPQATSPGQGAIPQPHETTSDDSDDPGASQSQTQSHHTHLVPGMKRPSPEPAENGLAKIQKKPKAQKKKKKRDPNEPTKPVSAYALFFRDTQAAIKGQNPNASFGEVSKIVASMWDSLDAEHKNVYKKKTEAAKKDYLKALAAYRASLVSKGGGEQAEPLYGGGGYGGYGGGYSGYSPPGGLPSPPMSSPQHHLKKQQQQQQQHMMQADTRQSTATQVMMNHMGQQQAQQQGQQQQQQQQQSQQQQQQHMQQQQPPQQVTPNNNYMQQQEGGGPPTPEQPPLSVRLELEQPATSCIRSGCTNTAVTNSEWEDEYCSNQCVVAHCRDVFESWVASNAAVKK